MKKNILFTVILCALIIAGTTVSYGQFRFGAVAGVNSATQSELGNIWNNEGMCCNLNAGLLSKYQFTDGLALKAGALFSQKGRSFDFQENGVETDRTDKFSYLEVPVKVEFSTALGRSKQRMFAAAGPYAAFLLDSKKETGDTSTSLDSQTKGTDFGIAFEIGYELPVAKHALQFSLNYDMGLTEIADYDTDLRNKSLSLNIGWLF